MMENETAAVSINAARGGPLSQPGDTLGDQEDVTASSFLFCNDYLNENCRHKKNHLISRWLILNYRFPLVLSQITKHNILHRIIKILFYDEDSEWYLISSRALTDINLVFIFLCPFFKQG